MTSRFLHGVSATALALALAAGPALAQTAAPAAAPTPSTSTSAPASGPGGRIGNNPAAATAPAQMSGSGPMTGGTAPAPGAQNGKMEGRVDQRINQLHRRLKITQAQEQQWGAFANVMRTNAQQMDQLWQQQMANESSMTAPQSMQAYSALASAHAQQVQQLVPAFQTLYDALSPQQKQIADKAFSPREGRGNGAQAQHSRRRGQPQQGADDNTNG